MVQLAYPSQMPVSSPGEIYGQNPIKIDTYLNTQNQLPFGIMIGKRVGFDDQCDLLVPGMKMLGVTRRDLQQYLGLYDFNSACAIVALGQPYVITEVDVTEDDPVYVRVVGKQQVQTIVFSANIITGNSIAASVNGNNLSATAFDTDNATTLTDLATKIAAQPGVASAVSDGTHTITVTTSTNGALTVIPNPVVTGGASQATATVTQTGAGIPNSQAGQFRNNNDSSTAIQVTNARWRTSTFTNGPVNIAAVDLTAVVFPL